MSQCERKASRLAAYGFGGRTGGWGGVSDSADALLDRDAAKVVVARPDALDPLDCSAVQIGAL
jgi:hypothetical protein